MLWKLLADGAGEDRVHLQKQQEKLQKTQFDVIQETMQLLGEFNKTESREQNHPIRSAEAKISPVRKRHLPYPDSFPTVMAAAPRMVSTAGRVSPPRSNFYQRQPVQPVSYGRPSITPERRVSPGRSPPTPVLIESAVLDSISVSVIAASGEGIYTAMTHPDTTVFQFLSKTISNPSLYVVRVSGIPIHHESRIGDLFIGPSSLQLCIERDNDVTGMFAKKPLPVNAPVLESSNVSKTTTRTLEYTDYDPHQGSNNINNNINALASSTAGSVSPSVMSTSQVRISQVTHQPIQPATPPASSKPYSYFQIVVDGDATPILLRLLDSIPLSSLFASRSLAKYAGSALVWGSTTLSLSKSPSHYNMPTAVGKPIRLTLHTSQREDLTDFERKAN